MTYLISRSRRTSQLLVAVSNYLENVVIRNRFTVSSRHWRVLARHQCRTNSRVRSGWYYKLTFSSLRNYLTKSCLCCQYIYSVWFPFVCYSSSYWVNYFMVSIATLQRRHRWVPLSGTLRTYWRLVVFANTYILNYEREISSRANCNKRSLTTTPVQIR